MRIRTSSPILATALTVLLAACGSTVQTESDINPAFAASINDWRTYAWMPPPENGSDLVNNDITRRRVQEAVDRELAARGYTLDPDNPDFRIAWHGSLDRRLDVQHIADPWGYGWRRWWTASRVRTTVTEYTEGTLVLDFVDADTNELAWRGVAQGRLSGSPTNLPPQSAINEAVEEILEEFPGRVRP